MKIFVSYAHENIDWVSKKGKYKLIPWLRKSLKRKAEIWDDSELEKDYGEGFKKIIQETINTSDIAILLMSQDFASSEFINNEELPLIKKRKEEGKLKVFPIMLSKFYDLDNNLDWLFQLKLFPADNEYLIDYFQNQAKWEHTKVEILNSLFIKCNSINEKSSNPLSSAGEAAEKADNSQIQQGNSGAPLRNQLTAEECFKKGHDSYYKKDFQRALDWYLKSSEMGNTAAYYHIGKLYFWGDPKFPKDYNKAIDWYKKAAEKENNVEAMCKIAHLSSGKAEVYWNTRAAYNGNLKAMKDLGWHFEIENNLEKAIFWYKKACENGDDLACNSLKELEKKINSENAHISAADCVYKGCEYDNKEDYAKAMEWYLLAAEKGSPAAMNNIGSLYNNGEGVPQDYSKAMEWYLKAADNGNTDAMYNIGNHYKNGLGVKKDIEQAKKWYTKACKNGDKDACDKLKKLQDKIDSEKSNLTATDCFNKGLENDNKEEYSKAMEWYLLAAEKGSFSAMINIGILYEYERGIKKDFIKAMEWYKKAADKGSLTAMCYIGDNYKNGKGVKKDIELAKKWYKKACENGNKKACDKLKELEAKNEVDPEKSKLTAKDCFNKGYKYHKKEEYSDAMKWYLLAAEKGSSVVMSNIGYLYYNGQGVPQDYHKAKEWFIKGAENGNATAMNSIGVLYDGGRGVPQDYNKAMEWYIKAADNGHALAMRNIGLLYYKGRGVSSNIELAIKWYTKACENGDKCACDKLKELQTINQVDSDRIQLSATDYFKKGREHYKNGAYTAAMKWYLSAVEKGSSSAMNNIGVLYDNGEGVWQDYDKAMEWYLKAVDKGDNSAAMNNIGDLFYYGRGVEKDFSKAMDWYIKATKNGNPPAMKNTGWLFDKGQGVPQDYNKAMEWYLKASENGNDDASNNIGELYYYGRGVSKDYNKAMDWYLKAAKNGNTRAMKNTGWLFDKGQGVTKDYNKAMEWYKKAANKENTTAMYNIGNFYENALGVDKDVEIAKKWYKRACEKGLKKACDKLKEL